LPEKTAAELNRSSDLLELVADLERRLAESERLRREESRYRTILVPDTPDVTEYKRVDEVLRQQLYIIETITSTAVDGIFMTDDEHLLSFVNPGGERMFGFSLAELRGRSMHDMVHYKRPDGSPHPARECPLRSNYTTREAVQDHRDIFFRRDGTPVYVSVSSAPMIRQGKLVATVVIVRDVTNAELAARELTETNQRLEAALATAEFGVWTLNAETGEVHWDDRMKALLGLSPPDRVTMADAFAFIHPDDREWAIEMLNQPSESKKDSLWECRMVRRDGSIRWFETRGYVVRDESGRVIRSHGVTGDITDRKQAQEVRERLAAIVESSDDSIFSKTSEGIITSWNRGAQAIFGYTSAEVIGKSVAVLIPHERSGELPMFLARLAQGEAIEHFETERVTKDGRRIMVSITLSPMRNESGAVVGASAITRDITRVKLFEEKIREVERMDAIGQLAGGIAHDFNNLLTIINGYAALALTICGENASLREQLKAIGAAGERATELTHQLLAFSRKQILQVRMLNINSVVEAMEPLLRQVIREEIECVIALDPTLPDIEADPHQIEQVLLNLVVNACDAMASGGRLRIETNAAVLDEDYARMHPDAVPGKYAVLSVSDSGTGIHPTIRARIFEPFFTTKPVGKGTGLGLSMVYGSVRQSGGHVTCSSEPGMGATFRVCLPAAAAKSVQEQSVEE
jgi:PAS domain S-box-containing protein